MAGRGGGRFDPSAAFTRARHARRLIAWLVLAVIALALAACSPSSPAPSSSPLPTSDGSRTSGSTPGGPRPPALANDATLRAAPQDAAREVARAMAGTPVRVAGRLEDGSWYVVEVVGRFDALGWVRATDLTPIDRGGVPVVSPPGAAAGPSTSASLPTDLPNLVVDGVTVRQNRLFVAFSNDGYTDLAGPFMVAVNGGAPHRIELPGKPLRPGDRIDSALEGEFVQRRASVSVVASVATPEESLDDNRADLTVEPDLPLDLEILTVVAAPVFMVTLRNNSTIPLVGAVTISVRESRPSDRLLTRLDDAPLNIARSGTQEFRIPTIVGADLTRVQVLIQTTAINDADLGNDVYPR